MEFLVDFRVHVFLFNFVPNIDCGYTLEPPVDGSSNEYPQFRAEIPCTTNFYYIKVGF